MRRSRKQASNRRLDLSLQHRARVQETATNSLTVEGEDVGRLEGFRFVPIDSEVAASTHLMAAANRALREAIAGRVAEISAADDAAFAIDHESGNIRWRDAPLARLTAGAAVVRPHVDVLASDLIDGPAREQVRQRLTRWFDAYLRAQIGPLLDLRDAAFAGTTRGLAFRLSEGLGCSVRDRVVDRKGNFSDDERKMLARAVMITTPSTKTRSQGIWGFIIAGCRSHRSLSRPSWSCPPRQRVGRRSTVQK